MKRGIRRLLGKWKSIRAMLGAVDRMMRVKIQKVIRIREKRMKKIRRVGRMDL